MCRKIDPQPQIKAEASLGQKLTALRKTGLAEEVPPDCNDSGKQSGTKQDYRGRLRDRIAWTRVRIASPGVLSNVGLIPTFRHTRLPTGNSGGE